MRVTRRQLLVSAASIPIALTVQRGLVAWADAARAGAVALRPAVRGTTATTCAMCGGADHTMLDPACPAARRVL